MPSAIVSFAFDPLLHLTDGLVVRWATVALAAVIVMALVAAALLARRTTLRPDDLLFIAVGTVPGAVIGGRLGDGLLHLEIYRAQPTLLFDPSAGGLELSLAVVGGLLAGGYVAHLLGAPVGRWLQVAVVPVLFALGAGKLTMILSGAGQGSPSTAAWATAYLGAGPWSSLAPAVASQPAQVYEGLATLVIAAIVAIILAAGGFARRDGRSMVFGIALWAIARMAVSVTWREPVVVGPLNAGSLLAAAVAAGAIVVYVSRSVRRRRSTGDAPVRP